MAKQPTASAQVGWEDADKDALHMGESHGSFPAKKNWSEGAFFDFMGFGGKWQQGNDPRFRARLVEKEARHPPGWRH